MAKFHPFRSFQRNKTGWMAALTLLAIISFIFLPAILDLMGGGRMGVGGPIPTIAESRRFGRVTEIELQDIHRNQQVFHGFLDALLRHLILVDPLSEEHRVALRPLETLRNQVARPRTLEELVNTWLIMQYAQEEGYMPNREDVSNLLRQLTGNTLTNAIYTEVLRSVGMTHQTVERLLIRHILLNRVEERFHLSVGAVSPATRWDWFQRVNRYVTIEAAAVPVDAFIGQVGEPSERQLNAFFETHRARRHNPESAESGFIMPMELAFQYVAARPTQVLLDAVTEEEMLEYYERFKEWEFRRPITPLPTPVLPTQPTLPVIPGFSGGALPFSTPDGNVITPLPMLPDVLPEIDEPVPSEPAEDAVEPVIEESIEESTAMSGVVTRFVSYQIDEVRDVQILGSIVFEEELTAENEATESATEESADTGGLTPPALEEPALDASIDLSVLYRPFDEVKEIIRERLARDKALEAVPFIMEKVQEHYHVYHDAFERGRSAPPLPDWNGFVAELGLELVTVPMGDIHAAMRTELAREPQGAQHLFQMFQGMPVPFRTHTFETRSGAVVYWVTAEKPEFEPERLADVRDIVVRRWKEVEARTLAMNWTQELATGARTSGRPLAEVFAGRSDVSVVETEPFTWMVYDIPPLFALANRIPIQPPRLGEIREVGVGLEAADFDNQVLVLPGWEFMEAVYALEVGEIGVVFNHPQTMVYVIRLTDSTPSAEELWERFQTAHIFEYIHVGLHDTALAREMWLDEIRAKTGFRWVSRPDSRGMHGDWW